MTRINVGISPKRLTDEHLLAEHREIKRLPAFYAKCKNTHDVPAKFCLGAGHVKFFMNKLLFAYERYKAIYAECLARGFNVQDYSQNFENVSDAYNWHTFIADTADRCTTRERICERIRSTTKQLHYYGKPITKLAALNMLYYELESI